MAAAESETVEIVCADGVRLVGDVFTREGPSRGVVAINPATGVAARYYHRYARFLARHGFEALTYDYRGIGASRPPKLRGCGYRWRDWGEQDFDAALRFLRRRDPGRPIFVVGHSIGGFLPGLSEHAPLIERMLTVGAQYGYWRDYARAHRTRLFLKWHVAMPAAATLFGYFPRRRLGWLEDLPAGVARDWGLHGARAESGHPQGARLLARLAAARAPILAVCVLDDEFATPQAVRRALAYYSGARRIEALLAPADLDAPAIGHFSLFHDRHEPGFWSQSLLWLTDAANPWPHRSTPVGA